MGTIDTAILWTDERQKPAKGCVVEMRSLLRTFRRFLSLPTAHESPRHAAKCDDLKKTVGRRRSYVRAILAYRRGIFFIAQADPDGFGGDRSHELSNTFVDRES